MQPNIVLDLPLLGCIGKVIGLTPSVQECLFDIHMFTVVWRTQIKENTYHLPRQSSTLPSYSSVLSCLPRIIANKVKFKLEVIIEL